MLPNDDAVMKLRRVASPPSDSALESLDCGDMVEITGVVYTARDAAHRRFCDALERGERLPIDLRGQIIYYVGPTPARPGQVIGSAGPTTGSRMDRFTLLLIEKAGIKATIGKGPRSAPVVDAMREFSCVYFAAIGGAGALLRRHVVASQIVCYPDLGTEAVRRLEVDRLPAVVAVDCRGHDLFVEGPARWRR